jgi:peptidoglycan/xylan/chitin deacetylase (PgdA/CDA1 family)
LAQTGLIHVGSHTKSHPILSQCPPDSQRRELLESRDALEQRGLSRRLFAYPNGGRGDFTGETKSLLAELGYRCAVTTIHGLNRPGADRYELKRIGIGADATLRRFQMRMAGF